MRLRIGRDQEEEKMVPSSNSRWVNENRNVTKEIFGKMTKLGSNLFIYHVMHHIICQNMPFVKYQNEDFYFSFLHRYSSPLTSSYATWGAQWYISSNTEEQFWHREQIFWGDFDFCHSRFLHKLPTQEKAEALFGIATKLTITLLIGKRQEQFRLNILLVSFYLRA